VKILHKYVLKEHLGPLIFSLATLTSLLLLNYIAKRFGDLVGKGLPWTAIAEFFGLSIPFTMALTFPMAVLVATLYAFGRLGSENEITALKASGVSLRAILTPVLIAAVFVTIFMVIFNDQIMSRANHQLAVLQSDIAQKKPTFALREQVINDVQPGRLYLRANHIDEASNLMREVTIYDMSDPTVRRTIYADSGNLAMARNQSDLLMTLYDGTMQDVPVQNPAQLQRLFFHTDLIVVKGVANQFQQSTGDQAKGQREMTVCEMQQQVNEAQTDYLAARQSFIQNLAMARATKTKISPEMQRADTSLPSHLSLGTAYCALMHKLGIEKASHDSAVKGPFAMLSALAVPALEAQELRADSIPAVKPQGTSPVTSQGEPTPTSEHPATTQAQKLDTVALRKQAVAKLDTTALRKQAATKQDTAAVRKQTAAQLDTARMRRALAESLAAHHMAMPPGGLPHPPVPGQITSTPQLPFNPLPTGILEANQNQMAMKRLVMANYEVEIHKKFALATACFVFVLLGAPIALRFPRGGVGLTIGVSLFVFALYYVGLIAGASLATSGIIPPWIAMWGANIIFTLVALYLLRYMGKEGSTARGGDAREMFDTIKQWGVRRLRSLGIAVGERETA
jgi:lipopolysaccharide export system permease protein